MSENTILDLDALLDGSLDNVQAAPDYVTPPPGNYMLAIDDAKLEKYKSKEGKEGVRIKLGYKVVQTIDLSENTDEPPVADGSMFSESFLYTEEGLPYFKKTAQNILDVKSIEGVSMRELLDGLKGTEFRARIGSRTSEKDGKKYENATIRPVHDTPPA